MEREILATGTQRRSSEHVAVVAQVFHRDLVCARVLERGRLLIALVVRELRVLFVVHRQPRVQCVDAVDVVLGLLLLLLVHAHLILVELRRNHAEIGVRRHLNDAGLL